MTGAGVFGKLPLRADFISRGLPYPVTTALENWVRHGMAAASRDPEFLVAYQTAPLWVFGAGGGLLDERPWVGTFAPSVDNQGRVFPIFMAAPGAEGSQQFVAQASSLIFTALGDERVDLDLWLADAQSLSVDGEEVAVVAPQQGVECFADLSTAETLRRSAPTLSQELFLNLFAVDPPLPIGGAA